MKDSAKALKEADQTNNYWQLLNHSTKKEVNKIVTDKILKLD